MRQFDRAFFARAFGPADATLFIALAVLGLYGAWPAWVAVVLAAGATIGGSLVRALVPVASGWLGLLPALVVVAAFVAVSPVGLVPDLLAGLAGLALLLWCSEEPGRYPGAFGRGVGALAVPATGLALALAGSALLPSDLGSLGVAAGLLVLSLVAVALLVGSPRFFDRDASATS